MTKDEIVKAITEKLDIGHKPIKESVDGLLEIMKDAFENNEGIEIRGFGQFDIRNKPSRPGRNPRTGKDAEITARKVVTFKSSKVLKNSVTNGGVNE